MLSIVRTPETTQPPTAGAAPAVDPRVAAAVAGDRAAARALLEALLPRARNLVRYLIRRDQDVDDIAQDALIAVLRGLGSFRGEGSFDAWADRIVARVTFAAQRRARREQSAAVVESREGGADLLLVSSEGTPDDYLQRRQAVELLDLLPLEQRRAVVLHHVVGMSVPEIASELGASPDTIKSRMRLGMARLRELQSPAPRATDTTDEV